MNPNAPMWKRFLIFLGPLMLGNILQALSGTINNVYLGQMLGVKALAAVSAFFPLLFFFISFVIGLGAGASVLIGQAFGAKEMDKVKAVAGTTLTITVVAAVLVAIFGGLLADKLLILLGTPPDILADATAYARIMLVTLPLFFLLIVSTSMLRGVGDTMTALYAFIILTVVGLVFTPAFIRGWAGLPQLGVQSAAAAGIISLVVAFTWMFFYLRRGNHPLAPDRDLVHHLGVDWGILKNVLRIGVPTGIQVVLLSVAEVAVLSFVNAFGSDATAAYGTVNQVVSYVQFPAISIAITASIFGAQAIGAGHPERLTAVTRTGVLMNVAITGGLVILAYLFSRTIIGFFITSPPVIELAHGLLQITLWSYVVFGAAGVFSGVMRASGTVLIPTALSIFAVLGIEVPVAYFLSKTSLGIDGIWIAYPVAFAAMLLMQSAYFQFVWRKKTITRLI